MGGRRALRLRQHSPRRGVRRVDGRTCSERASSAACPGCSATCGTTGTARSTRARTKARGPRICTISSCRRCPRRSGCALAWFFEWIGTAIVGYLVYALLVAGFRVAARPPPATGAAPDRRRRLPRLLLRLAVYLAADRSRATSRSFCRSLRCSSPSRSRRSFRAAAAFSVALALTVGGFVELERHHVAAFRTEGVSVPSNLGPALATLRRTTSATRLRATGSRGASASSRSFASSVRSRATRARSHARPRPPRRPAGRSRHRPDVLPRSRAPPRRRARVRTRRGRGDQRERLLRRTGATGGSSAGTSRSGFRPEPDDEEGEERDEREVAHQ